MSSHSCCLSLKAQNINDVFIYKRKAHWKENDRTDWKKKPWGVVGSSNGVEWKCKDCAEFSGAWTSEPQSPPDKICSLPWHNAIKHLLQSTQECNLKIRVTSPRTLRINMSSSMAKEQKYCISVTAEFVCRFYTGSFAQGLGAQWNFGSALGHILGRTTSTWCDTYCDFLTQILMYLLLHGYSNVTFSIVTVI